MTAGFTVDAHAGEAYRLRGHGYIEVTQTDDGQIRVALVGDRNQIVHVTAGPHGLDIADEGAWT